MGDKQLFLVEVFIETVKFTADVDQSYLQKKQISIVSHIGNMADIEIRSDGVGVVDPGDKSGNLNYLSL